MRRLCLGLCVISLAACGGGSGGRLYFGGSLVDPAPDGSISGLTAAETRILSDADLGGVAYGFGPSNQALRQSAGSTAGDSGFFAVAGLVGAPDVGGLPVSGRATMDGTYEVVRVTGVSQSANPANWTSSYEDGDVTVSVVFGEDEGAGNKIRATARSDDGRLVVRNIDIRSVTDGRITNGDVRYRGSSGFIEGELGADGMVAAIAGSGNNAIFAGGIVAETR